MLVFSICCKLYEEPRFYLWYRLMLASVESDLSCGPLATSRMARSSSMRDLCTVTGETDQLHIQFPTPLVSDKIQLICPNYTYQDIEYRNSDK